MASLMGDDCAPRRKQGQTAAQSALLLPPQLPELDGVFKAPQLLRAGIPCELLVPSLTAGAEPVKEAKSPELSVPGCTRARAAQGGADGTDEDPQDGAGDVRAALQEGT